MSWLLVAIVPIMLMLATVGLERIENSLTRVAPVAASTPNGPAPAGVGVGHPAAPAGAALDARFHGTEQPDRV